MAKNEVVVKKSVVDEMEVAGRLSKQFKVAEDARNTMLRESIKFGAMVIQWEQFLGSQPKREGSGVKGWLEEYCPEINYKTAASYKALAVKAVKMLGGGAAALAVLQDQTKVIDPNGKLVNVDEEIIEKRKAMFEEAKSRRQLEQMYFEFSNEANKGQAGRPVGSTGEYKKLTPVEQAVKIVWPMIDGMLTHRTELFHAYQLLPTDKLMEAIATFEEQLTAMRDETKKRK